MPDIETRVAALEAQLPRIMGILDRHLDLIRTVKDGIESLTQAIEVKI